MKQPKLHLLFYLSLILLGSSIPGDSMPPIFAFTWDKFLHVGEYFIVGYLGYRAFESELNYPMMFVLFLGILFGCFDEFWQSFTPGRFPSHYDVFADGIGVICGTVTASYIYKK